MCPKSKRMQETDTGQKLNLSKEVSTHLQLFPFSPRVRPALNTKPGQVSKADGWTSIALETDDASSSSHPSSGQSVMSSPMWSSQKM